MALFQSDRFMKTPQNHMESPKEKTVNLESILKEFDEERRTLEYPGAIREVSGPVVRHVSRQGRDYLVLVRSEDRWRV